MTPTDRYSEAPASGFPPGWSWRTYAEEPYQELVDDTDAVVASVDWGSSPVEYAVGGQTRMLSPEDWHVSPGGNVAGAGPTDVRAAIAEELGFGATPQLTPASGGQGLRDAAREATAASRRTGVAAVSPTATYARGR